MAEVRVDPRGEPVPGERVGPYEVLRPLARGGMATVFAVRDTRDDAIRGLKLLLPVAQAEEARTRFRREFRALSRLQHPNVLQVFEWGLRGDRPWFSMELVPGRDLRDEVEVWKILDNPDDRYLRVQAVLVQIARALAYIHDRGLVHRDITPGNIMVRPDGVVKLMDFGVAKELGTDVTVVGEMIGTVAYISPEQIGNEPIDPRADLYSLGAVLYLMLTGKRPFIANTLQGFLEKHLHERPRPPRELDPRVPPHLEDICLRLLEKSPSDRYASATHLLHVLGDTTGMDEADGRWPPRAVGRTLLRARLRDIIDGLASGGAGAAVVMSGPIGMGKTRLLDMIEAYARRRGLRVARGRARDDDRPFGAFIPIYSALAGDDRAIAPVVRAAFLGEDDGVVRERYPVIAAFRELIVERTPLVILIDDLEHADLATAETLEYLIRNTLALHDERVVFVVAEEADEPTSLAKRLVDAGERANGTRAAEPVRLEPLSASEVEELVLSVLPNDATSLALARRLHQESAGSPAFISDMLRGLADEGLLVREGRRFRLTIDASELTRSRLPMPASLRQALEERLQPLTEDARELGRVLSLVRRPLDLDALVKAAPFDEDRVMEALDILVEAEIVSESRQDEVDRIELTHHRFRDVLLEALSAADLMRRHQQLGEVLERHFRARPGVIVEELAFHFEQAQVAPKAYAYLQLTASRHLNRSLYDEALSYLDRAVTMEPTARPLMLLDDADRRLAEVHLERSRACYHLGDWAQALVEVRRAELLARDVRDPRLQSRIATELGVQLRGKGEVGEAEATLRMALQRAQDANDPALRPTPLYQLGALLWGRGDLAEAERLWRESLTTAQRTSDERAMGYGFNGLGILALCKGDSAEGRRQLEQSSELFERLGLFAPLTIARVNLVELYVCTGLIRKALQLADRTADQAREVHYPHGLGIALTYRTQVLLALGRHEEANDNAEEALAIFRRLGTVDDEVHALAALARVALEAGDPTEAARRVEAVLPLLNDYDTEGITPQVRATWAEALALIGRPDEARQALLAEGPGRQPWPLVQVRTGLWRGAAWRALGDLALAVPALQQALSIAEANGFRYYQLIAHDALARCVQVEATRSRHARVASALARSLAANLSKDDAKRFLAPMWGDLRPEATDEIAR